ncbi:hypothetical protein Dda_8751 [Drechslerella dactyloides]|uniref:Uncharacterized protein n=1 Tax=Drechslerella dactyloides TaxID=74499 RepID=A0AAD6IR54_DREDA|nr:hypothetical protein Dda_8751 [Drechslerella dactyloides]
MEDGRGAGLMGQLVGDSDGEWVVMETKEAEMEEAEMMMVIMAVVVRMMRCDEFAGQLELGAEACCCVVVFARPMFAQDYVIAQWGKPRFFNVNFVRHHDAGDDWNNRLLSMITGLPAFHATPEGDGGGRPPSPPLPSDLAAVVPPIASSGEHTLTLSNMHYQSRLGSGSEEDMLDLYQEAEAEFQRDLAEARPPISNPLKAELQSYDDMNDQLASSAGRYENCRWPEGQHSHWLYHTNASAGMFIGTSIYEKCNECVRQLSRDAARGTNGRYRLCPHWRQVAFNEHYHENFYAHGGNQSCPFCGVDRGTQATRHTSSCPLRMVEATDATVDAPEDYSDGLAHDADFDAIRKDPTIFDDKEPIDKGVINTPSFLEIPVVSDDDDDSESDDIPSIPPWASPPPRTESPEPAPKPPVKPITAPEGGPPPPTTTTVGEIAAGMIRPLTEKDQKANNDHYQQAQMLLPRLSPGTHQHQVNGVRQINAISDADRLHGNEIMAAVTGKSIARPYWEQKSYIARSNTNFRKDADFKQRLPDNVLENADMIRKLINKVPDSSLLKGNWAGPARVLFNGNETWFQSRFNSDPVAYSKWRSETDTFATLQKNAPMNTAAPAHPTAFYTEDTLHDVHWAGDDGRMIQASASKKVETVVPVTDETRPPDGKDVATTDSKKDKRDLPDKPTIEGGKDKPEKSEKLEKSEKPKKPEKIENPKKVGETEKPEKPKEKTGKKDGKEKTEPEKPEKDTEKGTKKKKLVKPAKPSGTSLAKHARNNLETAVPPSNATKGVEDGKSLSAKFHWCKACGKRTEKLNNKSRDKHFQACWGAWEGGSVDDDDVEEHGDTGLKTAGRSREVPYFNSDSPRSKRKAADESDSEKHLEELWPVDSIEARGLHHSDIGSLPKPEPTLETKNSQNPPTKRRKKIPKTPEFISSSLSSTLLSSSPPSTTSPTPTSPSLKRKHKGSSVNDAIEISGDSDEEVATSKFDGPEYGKGTQRRGAVKKRKIEQKNDIEPTEDAERLEELEQEPNPSARATSLSKNISRAFQTTRIQGNHGTGTGGEQGLATQQPMTPASTKKVSFVTPELQDAKKFKKYRKTPRTSRQPAPRAQPPAPS